MLKIKSSSQNLELWDVLTCYLFTLYIAFVTDVAGVAWSVTLATFILLVGLFLIFWSYLTEVAEIVKKEIKTEIFKKKENRK